MSKPCRAVNVLHPILQKIVPLIQRDIIDAHNVPMRLFETGRTVGRQKELVVKRKERSLVSRYIYNLEVDPPLYSTALNYVFYDDKWSWNIRDVRVKRWWQVFGEEVVDQFPELEWGGHWWKWVDYAHFQVKQIVLNKYIETGQY